ncbi:CDP-alcohol phosphatidyltransferase family protein [bacterium]|nr:CDP-alcohol phosphatidyltransferase family protein [bacterium]
MESHRDSLPEKRIVTIPNLLTALRFFMIPPILAALARGARLEAVAWMLASAATDFLDGLAARRLNQRSDLGRILDPLADKLTVLSVAGWLVFSDSYYFPVWGAAILAARELAVLLGGLLIIRGRKVVMESARPGKTSAFAVAVAVLLYVLEVQPWALLMLVAGLMLTAWSTWAYYKAFTLQLSRQC